MHLLKKFAEKKAVPQACRLVCDFNSVSRVQAALDQLVLIAIAPVATAVIQGSLWQYWYGKVGEGVVDAQKLRLQLRQEMPYKP